MKYSTDNLKKLWETKQHMAKRGLAHRGQSKEFLCDLGLMYDAISELANLSRQLQADSLTHLTAAFEVHHLSAGIIQRHSKREIRGGIEA